MTTSTRPLALIFALVVLAVPRLHAATPQTLIAVKLVGNLQTSAAGDFTPTTSEVSVQMTFSSSVAGTTGSLITPLNSRTLGPVSAVAIGLNFSYANAAALDAAFPDGTYTMTLGGASNGSYSFGFPTATPSPVSITNYAALQNVPGTSTIITWDPLPISTVDSAVVLLTVYNSSNEVVWSSSGLTATSRSATVTGLPADRTLRGVLSYASFPFSSLGGGVVAGLSRGASVRFPIVTRSPSDARLFALSCRAVVGTGGDVLIPGIAVAGSGKRRVVVRAKGPAIIGVTGTLVKPQLKLYNAITGVQVAENIGWDQNGPANTETLAAAFLQAGLPAFQPNSGDCALVADLDAGAAYTAVVSGLNESTGVALVEVYELGAAPARMSALSCRARVGTGDDILIPGIVLIGTQNKRMIIRASGPALAALGVGGTLAQLRLQLYNASGLLVAENTGWSTSPDRDEIFATTPRTGLSNFPDNSADCAILISLPPGGYTAHVSGVGGTTGVALIEVYEVP